MKKISMIVMVMLVFSMFSGIILAEDAPVYKLKFSTAATPNQPQTKAFMKFAQVVEDLSDGKIKVKIYHSGQLAGQKSQILGTMRGSIDMSDGSPTWFSDLASYPEISVLEAAYAYKDLNHLYSVVNGPIGKQYWDELRKRSGIVVLDTWYLGTRELNLKESVGEIKKPADLKGVKLRMPGSDAWMDVGRALGAQPTPLGFNEVYMGLKTGTIDGQDNPLPTDDANKFYEVTHYIVLTDHQMTIINPSINEKVWESMPKNYKVYMKKALEIARNYNNRMVLEQEANLLSKFVSKYGMEVVIPDKDAFMESAKEYYKKNEDVWGKGAYEKIQNAANNLYNVK